MAEIYSRFNTEDLQIEYIRDKISGQMGLRIVPMETVGWIVPHREDISDQPEAWFFKKWGSFPRAWEVEPLIQFSCTGDTHAGGFSGGLTMRNGSSVTGLKFVNQRETKEGGRTRVVTELSSVNHLKIEHSLFFSSGEPFVTCLCEVVNRGEEAVTLEMLSSFTLGGITPFDRADAPERLFLHRFRSSWSSEACHVCESLETLGLDPSWSHHGVRCERFGQMGSMPVRGWAPFAAVEDRDSGVFWGVQLEAPASWQIEAFRKDDCLSLSGGPADFEFGHWKKVLGRGESMTTPQAVITAVKGDFDDLCARLLARQEQEEHAVPPEEEDCPVVFNEWCTSWGQPRASEILETLPVVEALGIKYMVIDAGWYADGAGRWANSHGDWNVSGDLFPSGLREVCRQIRDRGLVPGLWYEFETAGTNAEVLKNRDWLLKRDGVPVRAGDRFFLDFRRADVRNYLKEKVTDLLKSEGFGYLKIDYNETIGLGCDGDDSPAEGLRQNILAVQDFIRSIRDEVPGIVIENCSSGGHRQEPSFMALTDMSSFSDAHETLNIPIIAAALQRLVLPRKCQVWAVLHPRDSIRRLYYSLSAAFLGRMCLSGEIAGLNPDQLKIVRDGVMLYRKIVPLIKKGKSRKFGPQVSSRRHPRGWQATVRQDENNSRALIVFHSFGDSPCEIRIPLPKGILWEIDHTFADPDLGISMGNGFLEITRSVDFLGAVILMKSGEVRK